MSIPCEPRLSSSMPTTSIEHESGAGAPPKQPAPASRASSEKVDHRRRASTARFVRGVFTRTSLEGGLRLVEKAGLSRRGHAGYATRAARSRRVAQPRELESHGTGRVRPG